MLYAVLCYDDETVTSNWSKEKDAEVMVNLGKVVEGIARQGRLGPVARLMPTTAATTLRKGKEPIIIDGPFAETKEQLLGFYVIDCENLNAAIETAKELAQSSASAGAFEIRPISVFNPVKPTL